MKKMALCMTLIGLLTMTGCNLGGVPAGPTATPTLTELESAMLEFDLTLTAIVTSTPAESPTPFLTETATPIPPVAPAVCTDQMVATLLDSFKRAMLAGDGNLLGSLISPTGLEVRYFRNGNKITYSPYQARFLFTTTYQAKWGTDPASGLQKQGAFHDVIVPGLVTIFNQPYVLVCNELRTGGTTYTPLWPYNKDFYSIHYAGTEANGFLDWHTWVIGVEYINGKPCLYALMQFYWEP